MFNCNSFHQCWHADHLFIAVALAMPSITLLPALWSQWRQYIIDPVPSTCNALCPVSSAGREFAGDVVKLPGCLVFDWVS